MNAITAIIATLTLASIFTVAPRKTSRIPPAAPPVVGSTSDKETPPPTPEELTISIDQKR